MASLQVDDVAIYYRTEGAGPCLVLLHGFIESSEIWDEYAAALSDRFTLVVIDLPGHGRSGCAAEPHGIDMMADCVHAVLTNLGIQRCVIAGHSLGGYVVLNFAERFSAMVAGFALVHSHPYEDSEEKKRDREMAIRIVKRNPAILVNEMIPNLFANKDITPYPEAAARLNRIASAMSAEGLIKAMEGMIHRGDQQHVIRDSKVPVLIVLGTSDPVMDFYILSKQLLLSTKVHPLVLEGVGHMGFIEAGDILLDKLEKFTDFCFTESD